MALTHLRFHLLFQARKTVPGSVDLTLGDRLQKRNYCGWIKFEEDADMPAVLAELPEKKVRNMFRRPAQECVPKLLHQIEGLKLHLIHNHKPFTNRILFAPEVASRLDRLTKDLSDAKLLRHCSKMNTIESGVLHPVTIPLHKTTPWVRALSPGRQRTRHGRQQQPGPRS